MSLLALVCPPVNVPAGHRGVALSSVPAGQYELTGQSVIKELVEVAAAAHWYPAGHLSHSSILASPSLSDQVPSGQLTDVATEDPAGHT